MIVSALWVGASQRAVMMTGLACALTTWAAEDWPQFRGPDGQGHSDAIGLPLVWTETKNVKWKTPIPGQGWSSPVVLGEQIWLTTATDDGTSLRALGVESTSGRILHDVEVFHVETPQRKQALNSYASPTPVLEPGRVYVSFGNYGNACLNTETAEPIWINRDLKLNHQYGPGSSPIIYRDLFILPCDGADVQFVAALNKTNGTIVWKTSRSGLTNDRSKVAFSTPLVITVQGRDQLISPGAGYIYAYDPGTGAEIWKAHYGGFSPVVRPLYGHGMIYAGVDIIGQMGLWAIRTGGAGDISSTHVVWKFSRQAPEKPSPVLVGDSIYLVSDNGIVTCLNARTGKEIWQERIEGEYSSSPVLASGRVYFFSQQGRTTVIAPDTQFQRLATNQLDSGFMASPAISGQAFFLRTKTHLYRIEN